VSTFHVYALHHSMTVLREIPQLPWLEKVHLPSLITDPDNGPKSPFAEGRFFLSTLEPSEDYDYVGQLNGRSRDKYKWFDFRWETVGPRLCMTLQPDVVVATWPTGLGPTRRTDWLDYSDDKHPGIKTLMWEVAARSGMDPLSNRSTIWANDFVCHRDVWLGFRRYWTETVRWLYGKYGPDPPFAHHDDPDRKIAYLGERVTCLYFANRYDLRIVSL
jgi:hypothetical protein